MMMIGSFLRACLGPLVQLMSHGPTGLMIGQEPRLAHVTTVAVLEERAKVEESTDLVRVDVRILARPDKGMNVPEMPAEAGAMIADLLHAMTNRPRGVVQGEMSAADAMAPLTTVAIVTATDAEMIGVISRIPLRLADLRLATAAGMVKGIAVGMEEASVGEMTRPATGKNPGPGGRRVSQSSSALEGRG